MRIGGLASGIDTDSIIRDMMNAKRIPLNKINQKKQFTEWQVDNYRTANRRLNDFSKMAFDNMILSNKYSSKTVTISSPDDVLIRSITSTSDFSGTIKIDQLARNSTMQSSEITSAKGKSTGSTLAELGISGTTIKIDAIDKDGVLKPGTEFTFESTAKLSDVIDKINKESGVNAFFDSKTGKIAMTSKHGGKLPEGEKEIVVTGSLAIGLGLVGQEVASGQNAIFHVNGLKMERSTNKVEVNGFEFTLKEANAKEISFSSAPDTDAIVENVVKFVDEYNKLIEDLNKQIREPVYRSFHPLSAEEKADMKEKEIEQWEEKAMSGTLRNDPILSSMLTKMRTALMGNVGGESGTTLADIGITASKSYTENGKLIINETDLRKAINDDPSKVHQLFSKDGDKIEDQGFARRLKTIVDDSRKDISKRAGKIGDGNETFTMGRSLSSLNKQIETFELRLQAEENRMWRQFSAMEQAINRANAQSAGLMSALGGGM
ncbi:flagellar filament capping protein FliD [Sporosarcina sp. CAU 1771]